MAEDFLSRSFQDIESNRPTAGVNPGDRFYATDTERRYVALDTGQHWVLDEPEEVPETFADLQANFRLLLSVLNDQSNIVLPDQLREEMEKL